MIMISLFIIAYAEVDLEVVARGTPGFSGADLANLVNQAALHGSALGREAVVLKDLDFAKLVHSHTCTHTSVLLV